MNAQMTNPAVADGPAILVRGAAAIMTGLSTAPRAVGPDIRIRGGVIEELGVLQPSPGESVIDAADCVVYPGWVNTHHHLLQSLMKGVPAGMSVPLRQWLDVVPFAFRMRFDENMLQTAALLGLAELALSGCTTVADFHNLYYPGIAFDSSSVIFEAADRLGMRMVLCRGFNARSRPTATPEPLIMPPETLSGVFADLERLAASWHDPSPAARRRVVAAPSSFTQSLQAGGLKELAAATRRLGLRMHSHLAETQDDVIFCRKTYGMRPLEFAASQDWIGPDVWFAHLVHVDSDDIRILADSGTGIAHCAGSNARIGNGVAPALEMRKTGVPISIGQDGGAANDPGDFISEVHFAWYVHRAKGGHDALSIGDVIHWGTRGGAKVLGLEAVGAIAPGFEADLAIYELDDIRFAAFHDVGIAPVATGVRPRLKRLLVGGRAIVVNDQIVGFDLGELQQRVRAAVRQLTTL
jgi:cytosine/adenosine deaminase-related metal-dependent hydrolase